MFFSPKTAVIEVQGLTMMTVRAIRGAFRRPFYFRNILPRIGQLLVRNDAKAYSYLPDSVGEFPAGQALADKMRDAGLTQVNYHPLTFGIATLYIGVK